MKAIWNETIIAESDDTVVIEGNHYFPADSIKQEFFKLTHTHASYYSIEVEGETNKDAAWFYPEVSELAKSIKGKVAFWKGVKVVD